VFPLWEGMLPYRVCVSTSSFSGHRRRDACPRERHTVMSPRVLLRPSLGLG
jgi:hypothetical protein